MRIKLEKLLAATRAGISIDIDHEHYIFSKGKGFGKLKIQKEPIYFFALDSDGKESQISFSDETERLFIEMFLKVEHL